MVASRNQRNSLWFFVLLALMVGFGFCTIGYWQSYTLTCPYGRSYSFTQVPPQYVCNQL